MARPLTATIDLNSIKRNYQYAKKLHPTCNAFAVIKSNAYGHGAVKVATYLDDEVDAFAVASIDEALIVRDAGVKSTIMLLEGVFEAEEWAICQEKGFWAAIENQSQLDWLLESKAKIGKVFVKVDTGMHRLGLEPSLAPSFVEQLKSSGQVDEVLLMTHFASADDLSDITTMEQLTRFEMVCRDVGDDIATSVANSSAIMKWSVPEGGWIRPGIMLYGISPFAGLTGPQLGLSPAMTLTTKVISVRKLKAGDGVGYSLSYKATEDHQLATVAVGYGDGYPRHAQTGTPLKINGVPATLAGRVSMDMITVKSSSDTHNLLIGQDVELWGNEVPVEEVADFAGTIGYELVARMTSRPRYVYKEGESES